MRENVALLAPVPLEHLIDGVETCRVEGRVAFGSDLWELLENVDLGTPVLIYASWADEINLKVTWSATFVRFVRTEVYSRHDLRRYRPPSTRLEGEWCAGYYEVSELHPLPADECISLGKLRSPDGKCYDASWPRAPRLVAPPEGPTPTCSLP